MKRKLKLAISLALRVRDLLHDGLCWLVGREVPARCMVLYYHTVPAGHRELFARQLDTILKLARPISTNPNGTLAPGGRYVAVTFDDGFISVMQNAAPELKKRQIPWTMFVPSGCIGKKPDWLRQAHPAAREDRVMTAAELCQLAKDPLVSIGSHTANHANLLETGSERAADELTRSKSDLEAILGKAVQQFSYPFGARSSATDGQARAAGYTHIFSSDPCYASFPATAANVAPSVTEAPKHRSTGSLSTSAIGRASVDPDISPLEFRLKLLGAYRWLARIHRSTEAAKH